MKILIVYPSLEFGGIERTTINLLRNIERVQTAIVLHKGTEHYFENINCRTYNFEDFGAINPTLSLTSIYAYSKAVKKVSSLEGSDIVLGIMQFAPIYASFAKDFFFMKSKVVASYRGVISEYFKKIPIGRWTKFLAHYSIKRASNIIVPSEGIKRDLIEHFGASKFKIKVIYNGIDIDSVRDSAKETIQLKKDCPWILTSCRLSPQKDFPTLLKAFRKVRDQMKVKLIVLGEGPIREQISIWSKELKIGDDLLLLGFQKNPFKYIARADVFVLSSFFEGFGNVIVEAMATGVPVISTDCPSGPGEIIEHGVNGLLVPVQDHNKMAENILNVLGSRELRQGLSQAGIMRAEEFSAKKMAQNYEEYLIQMAD